ncbi:MAG: hypothetical protein AUG75_06395 [Cyanobacteria bacterium 13_1_20CM_4_61_6]|nr:MAG: hypothetical protein AUI36_15130 [Cyanobacteria bacterium 13_1_40CM_2_61_4]OLE97593.1 MAG: hypothetical protein AUG75_06395 [Cyanobacteria bacterium 13_1_20CM_4_61_6]
MFRNSPLLYTEISVYPQTKRVWLGGQAMDCPGWESEALVPQSKRLMEMKPLRCAQAPPSRNAPHKSTRTVINSQVLISERVP